MNVRRNLALGMALVFLMTSCRTLTRLDHGPFALSSLRGEVSLSRELTQAGFSMEDGCLIMRKGGIRLVLDFKSDPNLRESYQALDREGQWIEVLTSSTAVRSSELFVFTYASESPMDHYLMYDRAELEVDRRGMPVLRLLGGQDDLEWEKRITPDPLTNIFHVQIVLHIDGASSVHSLESVYHFSLAKADDPPDYVWTPCLRPAPRDVIADHCFRSPAVILQKNGVCCSLIPDVDLLSEEQPLRTAMDLMCGHKKGPKMSFGFVGWRTRGHVYYERDPLKRVELEDSSLRYGFSLLTNVDEPEGMGYRKVTRFMWNRYGRPRLRDTRPLQNRELGDWEREIFAERVPEVYRPVEIPGIQGGILKSKRAGWTNGKTDNDAWFSAKYQSLRTAYGMFLYGEAHGQEDLIRRARSVVDLALHAPCRGGVFPTIFCLSDDGRSGEWLPDSGWAGYADCFHAFDASWSGCWLLKIISEHPEYTDIVLAFLSPYAEFLLARQSETGAIPSWFDVVSLAPRSDLVDRFPAETASSALFLARLHELSKKDEHLAGAKRAMEFISREVLYKGKWFDFETFLSRSRKPFDFFDAYTRQYPQSTLSMFQAAWAYLALFRQTLEEDYLAMGVCLLDYLSFYQQIWSPPYLHAPLFGGFGVQNTDGEWSDARSAYASDLYFDFYEATGYREYFERGAAALRAGFAASPYEYWSQGGIDGPGINANIHWGAGSAAVSSLMHRKKWGDAFINAEEGWGCGLNACSVLNLSVDRHRIEFDLNTPSNEELEWTIKFDGLKYGAYQLTINGSYEGIRGESELRNGIRYRSRKEQPQKKPASF